MFWRVCFLILLFFVKALKTCSSAEKGYVCLIFSVSLCFSLAFCFTSLFNCLSLSLFLCFSFFLPSLFSFYFAFFCFLVVFVSLFLCLVSLLLFHANNNIKISTYKVVFINAFNFWFSVLFCLSKPVSLSLFFLLILSCVSCSTSMFYHSKRQVRKTPIFGQEGGCIFFAFFCQMLVDVQKNCKYWYFNTCLKQKRQTNIHSEVLFSGPSRCYYLVQA